MALHVHLANVVLAMAAMGMASFFNDLVMPPPGAPAWMPAGTMPERFPAQ